MDEYKWWGGKGSPPENLKTKKQLRALGLSPLTPTGVIKTPNYDLLLYDTNNPECCRPKKKLTDKQQAVLAANRTKLQVKREYEAWYKSRDRLIEDDRVAAVLWARDALTKNDWVILDTKIAGLNNTEIVEIAIINHLGETALNTLVKPSIPVPTDAVVIDRINDETVENAPTFLEVHPWIVEKLEDKKVLIYNSIFAIKVLAYYRQLHGLEGLRLSKRSDCIMKWHAQWAGNWSDYHESYRQHPLKGSHRALDNCLAALDRIKCMAADSGVFYCPVPKPE
jgi:DNA polymerase-3 subunit epsilon